MHKFYSYISKFACIKFQTNVKRFCYIIAIYFSGHSVHTVLACVQIYEESATYFWNMYLPNAGASHINKQDVMHGIIISAYGGPQVPHYFWIKHAQQHELGQDAQLSQRDRAAGYISFVRKWKTGTQRQYFTDIVSLASTTVT